jgi:hypothetical protein
MSFLGRLFRRDQQPEAPDSASTELCPHTALSSRWENPDHIGDDTKATRFDCTACGASFTPEEAERVRAETGQRLKETFR